MDECFQCGIPWDDISFSTYTSEKKPLGGIADCFVFIVIRRTKGDYSSPSKNVNISVHKTITQEITADITIDVRSFSCSLPMYVSNSELFPWTDSCVFKNIEIEKVERVSVTCKIKYYDQTPARCLSACPTLSIINEFQRFFLRSSFSDVRIIIGREELPAHKIILATHSPVFLSMFESNMKEGKGNQIDITDITADVMKNVLTFLYTGCDKALDHLDMAMRVLVVAEKYDMEKLKNLCEHKLLKHLKISNALEMIELADAHNARMLMGECWKLAIDHKKEIVNLPNFEPWGLENPKLMCAFTKDAING